MYYVELVAALVDFVQAQLLPREAFEEFLQ